MWFSEISSRHLPLWVRHTLLPAKALIYSCSLKLREPLPCSYILPKHLRDPLGTPWSACYLLYAVLTIINRVPFLQHPESLPLLQSQLSFLLLRAHFLSYDGEAGSFNVGEAA